jgi:hypothetical protein
VNFDRVQVAGGGVAFAAASAPRATTPTTPATVSSTGTQTP